MAVGHTGDDTIGWVVEPEDALELSEAGIPGWRLTVVHSTDRASVVDALARTEAAYLRTGRSRVAEAAEHLCAAVDESPGIGVRRLGHRCHLAAVEAGATDLLLRDWDSERIGGLREAVGGRLCERVAIPPRIAVNEARESLPAPLFKVYLNLVDAGGRARPRYTWAPGMPIEPPLNARRFSAAWPDAMWTVATAVRGSTAPPGRCGPSSRRPWTGFLPTVEETATLF